jgi:hypothetical protein
MRVRALNPAGNGSAATAVVEEYGIVSCPRWSDVKAQVVAGILEHSSGLLSAGSGFKSLAAHPEVFTFR